ncbi:MAG: AAA family ATPase [Patescibacteria group bacterium]|nr:AAA family ATPase [Patescibacteria group bacterium]
MESNQKIVIGIVGANGSGKDTVCDYLVEKHKAEKLVFSDLLKEALQVFIGDIGRSDYAWLATILREKYGEGILAHSMQRKIDQRSAKIVVIAGVRDRGELKMIKSYQNGILICVETNLKIRWKRLVSRNVKADDKVSLEVFKETKENLPSEKYIQELSNQADYTINNNGDFAELEKGIDEVVSSMKL